MALIKGGWWSQLLAPRIEEDMRNAKERGFSEVPKLREFESILHEASDDAKEYGGGYSNMPLKAGYANDRIDDIPSFLKGLAATDVPDRVDQAVYGVISNLARTVKEQERHLDSLHQQFSQERNRFYRIINSIVSKLDEKFNEGPNGPTVAEELIQEPEEL